MIMIWLILWELPSGNNPLVIAVGVIHGIPWIITVNCGCNPHKLGDQACNIHG